MFAVDDKDSEEKNMDTGARAESRAGEMYYKPLFMISSSIGRSTLIKRLCVAISLPSGIGSRDFTITVVDGGFFFYSFLYDGQSL